MICPICSNDSLKEFRPFCSKRCADVDLGRWMSGSYALPSQDPDNEAELAEELEKALDKIASDASSGRNSKPH